MIFLFSYLSVIQDGIFQTKEKIHINDNILGRIREIRPASS